MTYRLQPEKGNNIDYLCELNTFTVMVVHVQAVDNSSVASVVEAVPQLAAFQRLHITWLQIHFVLGIVLF